MNIQFYIQKLDHIYILTSNRLGKENGPIIRLYQIKQNYLRSFSHFIDRSTLSQFEFTTILINSIDYMYVLADAFEY